MSESAPLVFATSSPLQRSNTICAHANALLDKLTPLH
jgi:hypothetical protein